MNTETRGPSVPTTKAETSGRPSTQPAKGSPRFGRCEIIIQHPRRSVAPSDVPAAIRNLASRDAREDSSPTVPARGPVGATPSL
jgi:hypothetical protein